ncbi:oligoendopeptidase F [Candidatus Epulonipiscium fishelsonii]|uniref:Oligoendopeptidase F n=1 Tax=Candidatus Epulonipiscium fishelsonii TaxID=77094 RepID=A0ACC8XA51_9FIRM|nr:oligoendopeptidase F [Epulopiscium sp. SCG-B11WGA-EpuloA1]ONI43178.1 oligoendopeptidase F [Epulopiscium sp. SCG-B05WGA-EpuloA1]
MKFKDFKYERPDFEQFKKESNALIQEMQNAETANDQITIIKKIHKYESKISTLQQIASVRHTIDTKDEFYSKENEYWDEYSPLYDEIKLVFAKALVNSKFRLELEAEFGSLYFKLTENSLKVFSPEVIKECQEENKLSSEYDKLIASAQIEYKGKTYNLAGLGPFRISKDRQERKETTDLYINFFKENKEKFEDIYDKLVKIRHEKAKKLGFNNYVEFGYVNMNRMDYNKEMVANFRKQVKELIVPVASKLYEDQKQRLGLEILTYYDEDFEFTSGNAKPHGDADFILDNGKKMYDELSAETKEFFDFMTDNELLDLETKPGKQGGGYCTYFADYKSPFIFSNFNGTSEDVDVLTHEAGHGFQLYSSRHIEVPRMIFATCESCEIHSMSMEFITWPWMELFFEEETNKYKYTHLASAMKFIPYGVTVDEFQHFIYENPQATKEERNKYWRKLEKEYLPHKNYMDCELLEEGCWWFRQGHIFAMPFYYIDYTLAQICALQFWKKMNDNREVGWQEYLAICKVGGTKSFLQLVELANLISPFEDGCIASVINEIKEYLDNIDDKKL